MCGIHFVVNSVSHLNDADDFLANSFMANQVRGTDSSGIFQVDNKINAATKTRDVRYLKRAVNGTEFLNSIPTKEIVSAATRMPVTVGHVRAATFGSVTQENAHPFVSIRPDGSRIIGVHNGSLQGWDNNVGADEHQVDSAWLFDTLAKDGIAAFEGFNGAFALVWYDSKHPNSLFVARNEKRTLFWAHTEGGKGLIACSELGMLGWLADRNNIKLQADAQDRKFFYPEAGYIHEIDITDPRKIEKTKFADYDANKKKYELPKPVISHPLPHTNITRNPRAPVASTTTTLWEEADARRQVSQLKALKDALAAVRSARNSTSRAVTALEEEEIVNDEALEANLTAEIQEFLQSKDKIGSVDPLPSNTINKPLPPASFCFELAPTDDSATTRERERAKGVGIFGLRVEFVGYFYDEETAQIYGDFRTLEGGEEVVYDAVIRGMSRKVAEDRYINPTACSWMAVVGVTQNEKANADKPYIVIAPINTKSALTTIYNSKRHQQPARSSLH
jgi:hypothetical protein